MLRAMSAFQPVTVDHALLASSWRFGAPAAVFTGEISVSPMVKRGHVRHTGNVWPLRPQEVSSG